MKKIVLSLLCAIFLAGGVQAQIVTEHVAPFKKDRKPAFSMHVEFSKKLVEEAVALRFKRDKIKGKSDGPMMAYIQARYPAISTSQCDIYTQVEQVGKSASVIYIFVSKGYENFVSSGEDEEIAGNIKTFMHSLIPDIRALELKYQIEDQTKVLSKSQQEYEKLTKQKSKMEKDLEKLNSDIEKADKNRQQQKDILDELKQKESKVSK